MVFSKMQISNFDKIQSVKFFFCDLHHFIYVSSVISLISAIVAFCRWLQCSLSDCRSWKPHLCVTPRHCRGEARRLQPGVISTQTNQESAAEVCAGKCERQKLGQYSRSCHWVMIHFLRGAWHKNPFSFSSWVKLFQAEELCVVFQSWAPSMQLWGQDEPCVSFVSSALSTP